MNVLIVDDQEKILKAVSRLVDWKKLNVDEVYTADSAAAAKAILEEHDVSIMLTDIEMPGEDGIALQKWQAQEFPSAVCIFLTSHADFSYAREAIHNGVFDYILQPASIPEIEDAIRRCIDFIREKELLKEEANKYDPTKIQVSALFYQYGQFFKMEEFQRILKTDTGDWTYIPCLAEIWGMDISKAEERFSAKLKSLFSAEEQVAIITCAMNSNEIGFLLYSEQKMENTDRLKEKLTPVLQEFCRESACEMNIYISGPVKDDLPVPARQIMEFRSGRVLKRNEVYSAGSARMPELRKPDGTLWGKWLIRGDAELVRNQITNLLRYAEESQCLTVSYMQEILHAFLEACSVACYEQKKDLSALFTDDYPYDRMLHANTSAGDLREGVDYCLRQYMSMLSAESSGMETDTVHKRIEEVIRYLDENMDRMISRREAAKYVFLNEDYFTRMFKKETGMGYKEFVLDRKMDYAKKLLSDTDMPVVLVASKVGYDNFSNFTQMFKKTVGSTPSDYRKDH